MAVEQPQSTDTAKGNANGKLTVDEKTEEGAVTLGVYLQYAKMVGTCMCACIIVLIVCVNANNVAVNWWLSRWSVSSSLLASEDTYVKSVFIVHVGGTRCVTSSTDNIMKIHVRITLTVEVIRTCIFLF
jgi:hypothetical protein